MTKLRTAQQFFLPRHDGDHSAFQPYYLGEVVPRAEDMDGFILETLYSAQTHFASSGGKTNAVRLAIAAYENDSTYAEALRAWCLAEAQREYNA